MGEIALKLQNGTLSKDEAYSELEAYMATQSLEEDYEYAERLVAVPTERYLEESQVIWDELEAKGYISKDVAQLRADNLILNAPVLRAGRLDEVDQGPRHADLMQGGMNLFNMYVMDKNIGPRFVMERMFVRFVIFSRTDLTFVRREIERLERALERPPMERESIDELFTRLHLDKASLLAGRDSERELAAQQQIESLRDQEAAHLESLQEEYRRLTEPSVLESLRQLFSQRPGEAEKKEEDPSKMEPPSPKDRPTLEDLLKKLSSKVNEDDNKDNDNNNNKNNNDNNDKDKKKDNRSPILESDEGNSPAKKFLLALAGVAGFSWLLSTFMGSKNAPNIISFHDFQSQFLVPGRQCKVMVVNREDAYVYVTNGGVDDLVATMKLGSVEIFENQMEESQRLLGRSEAEMVEVRYVDSSQGWTDAFWRLAPTVALVGVLVFMTRNAMSSVGSRGGSGLFGVTKSNVKRFDKQTVKTNFKEVAGCDEAKQEIMEFVEFLKNPAKFERLGAKAPKGALLVGPPGTGKTLLARATAGEASVPFFSVSGSDFIEMFVGVGPARVRDLFAQARANAPCILFIDEIDAVGRARGRGGFRSGGNDERENTLNQILVEMDGMDTKSGVVVLAGTNRADVLDKALVRSGRFDRQIAIDLPDVKAREDIFLVHLKKLKLELVPADYAPRLASLTPGFSGADIANVCNEAALVAARYGAKAVHWKQFEHAIDRVIAGLERKTRILSASEKRTVAYHEAGHAVAGWFLRHADPLLKVSIVPRGAGTLGFAQYNPRDAHLYTREQIMDRICMALGGRVSEQLNFGRITTGAADDLDKVTKMAYGTVVSYGMGTAVGPMSYPQLGEGDMTIGKPYSEEVASKVDEEVMALVRQCYERTTELLQSKFQEVGKLAELLIEKEVVGRDDVEAILGKRPFGAEHTITFKSAADEAPKETPVAAHQ